MSLERPMPDPHARSRPAAIADPGPLADLAVPYTRLRDVIEGEGLAGLVRRVSIAAEAKARDGGDW